MERAAVLTLVKNLHEMFMLLLKYRVGYTFSFAAPPAGGPQR
jgi:hypothetical protein